MVTSRTHHTATLLLDGRVLVAGGVNDGQPLASAELYDPSSRTWAATGSMAEPRFYFTATRLRDGKVLVTGGSAGLIDAPASATAELYDPRNGSWTRTGKMIAPRQFHTATLLLSGKVLVAGGNSTGGRPASAELYDPRSGTWTATGPMVEVRLEHVATLLLDGQVLVLGGGGEAVREEGAVRGATAEIYNPSSGRWRPAASMSNPRSGFSATLLPDGMVLVVGGDTGDEGAARSAERYAPSTGRWTTVGSMAEARSGHTATLLPNDTVLVVSGVGLGSDPSARSTAELYAPISGVWTAAASPNVARFGHTATLLADGNVLVVGGTAGRQASAEMYHPGAGS